MAGVEAAGLLLGVLPLMISAAEHYEDISRPFRRYLKFSPELQLYQQQLCTQRTIFRNECQKLLSMLIDRQTAKDMLKESKHYLWKDPELNEKMIQQLGNSATSCQATIDLIQARLKEVEEETEKFGLAMQQSMPLSSIGDKAWRSRVAKKLKFSISEPRLEKALEGLRKLNQDFRTLAGQTTWFNNIDTKQQVFSLESVTYTNKQKVKEFKMVQNASLRLYQALERACRIHEAHSAHFRLESQVVTVKHEEKSIIRFNIAFSQHLGASSTSLEPVWITVESTFETSEPANHEHAVHDQVQNALNDLSGTLKRSLSQPSTTTSKRAKGKSVRFAPTASRSSIVQASIAPLPGIDPALPDFCVQHDFCAHLSKCNPKVSMNRYIGCFEKAGPYKHLVYFAPPITSCTMRQSVSLAQIVESISKRPRTDQLLQYERLRLARQLASAVLQYHATPLLGNSWRSDDVVFFGKSESTNSLSLPPHLNVQVGRSNRGEVLTSNKNGKSPVHPYIRNTYLFNLGIILIEIAQQAPLLSLRSPRDPDLGQEDRYNEFLLANRLSQSIGSSLGSSYGKVVRKCLGCDFGEGTTDLGDPGLQAVFYRDVVCELERLERGFAMLQLGE